jgi:hypothetical protein
MPGSERKWLARIKFSANFHFSNLLLSKPLLVEKSVGDYGNVTTIAEIQNNCFKMVCDALGFDPGNGISITHVLWTNMISYISLVC